MTADSDPHQLQLSEQDASSTPADESQDSPEIVALRAQVADAQRRESELNARLESERTRLDTFLSREPSQPASTVQRVDPHDSPDPAIDLEGFNRHQAALHAQQQRDIDERIAAQTRDFEQRNETRLNEISQQQKGDQDWAEFQRVHPQHAGQRDLAGLAYQRIAGRGAVPQDTAGLISAVKTEMDQLIGTPTSTPNRTGGVGGGSPPPRTTAPPKDPSKSALSFVEVMQQHQIDEGII